VGVLRNGGTTTVRCDVAFLGPAISVLGALVAPLRPFEPVGGLLLVCGAPGLACGLAVTSVGVAVPAVGLAVASVCGSITLRGVPVTVVRGLFAFVGRLVGGFRVRDTFPSGLGLVAGRRGTLSRASRLVAQIGRQVTLVRGRSRSGGGPGRRDPVAFFGDPVALVRNSVALVRDAFPVVGNVLPPARLFRSARLCRRGARIRLLPLAPAGQWHHHRPG
jgi:hypothetical protein